MTDLSARLPKRVKVGSYNYALARVPRDSERLEDNYGITYLETSEILFDESMTLEHLLNTVLHELQHAINYSYGLDNRPKEEAIATQTANGWMQVYRDNPKLEMWLHHGWRELRKTR